VLVLATAAGGLEAQTLPLPKDTAPPPPIIQVGQRVRIWQLVANDLSVPLKGTVTHLGTDTVGVNEEGLKTPVNLPRQLITRVELSKGPQSGSRTVSTLTGMLIGTLSGAVLGVIAGDIAHKNAAKAGALGGVLGLVAGGGIGYASPGEAWGRAQLPPAPPATAP
jgi:hypothetical protein